jgi:hypothetical protein
MPIIIATHLSHSGGGDQEDGGSEAGHIDEETGEFLFIKLNIFIFK